MENVGTWRYVPHVPQSIVVLGAGFGGLELVTMLSDAVADQVEITLIDKSDSFIFGFSKLDVLFGRRTLDEVRARYADLLKPSVQFRKETVRSIDASSRTVVTDATTYRPDVLVVALGADYDIEATPGLSEGGFEFYTPEGAERAGRALAGFTGGKVVISVLGPFFKCPGAPNETALLTHDFLEKSGVRGQSTIHLTSPLPMPIPISRPTSDVIISLLEEAGVEYWPGSLVTGLDPEERVAHFADGRSLGYDLFLGIPVHRAPEVVAASDLCVDGWIPVDPATFETSFPGIFAVGDVTSAPVPRAGAMAEGEARTVAEVLIARLQGSAAPAPFDGGAACYVETGRGTAARIDVNFLAYESPRAEIVGPTAGILTDKAAFGTTRLSRWFGYEENGS